MAITECHINKNANVFIKFILKMVNSSLEKIIKSNKIVINDIQKKIIDLIINDKYITQSTIANKLNVSIRTIKRHFKILIENGIIKRIGYDKNGYWKVL